MTQHQMAPSDRFVASKIPSVVLHVVMAAVCLGLTGLILQEARRGAAESGSGIDGISVVFMMVTIVLALVLLARIPVVLKHRFEIGPEGLWWGTVHVPWAQVQAVRLLVLRYTKARGSLSVLMLMTTTSAANRPRPPGTPNAIRSSTRVSLEIALYAPGHAELEERRLVKHRIPGWTEGYTHHLKLGPGPLFPTSDPTTYAPDVQAILSRVARPIYYGVAIRETWTTWSR